MGQNSPHTRISSHSGLFITFEGTEGSGKSTQIEILRKRIIATGQKVVALREPGGTAVGEEIRNTLKKGGADRQLCAHTELLLMNASRAQLVAEVIHPALERGEIVLCDRFYDSSIAYQGYGRQLDLEKVRTLIDFAVGSLQPNLTLLLQIPFALSEDRRKQRQGSLANDRFEEADREFFKRVEIGFEELANGDAERIRTVDATQSIENVSEAIWKWVGPLVNQKEVLGEKTYKSVGEWGRHQH